MNNEEKSGHLDVGDGHQLYWENWGNQSGVPVIALHGGPGSGFKDSHKEMYSPDNHNVMFFDQRGAGRSTPFASTENNTTQDLVDDIEKIRELAGFDQAHIVGGSWGSFLAMSYAIEHPERVKSLLIWGIYLARQFENDWVNEGYPRYNFPSEWERFISLVPDEHRNDGSATMAYYAEKIRSDDPEEAEKYAIEWSLWESTLLSINYDPSVVEQEVREDPNNLAIAKLETHFFMNNCFVPQDHILDNIDKLRQITCVAIQGRFDMCTPPIAAHNLKVAYGEKMDLQWVNSGHYRNDPELFKALSEATLKLG